MLGVLLIEEDALVDSNSAACMSILRKSTSIASLYLRLSKRSGEAVVPRLLYESVGKEVRGEEVTKHDSDVPLRRGGGRTAERLGERVRGVWGGGKVGVCFFAAMLLPVSQRLLSI